LPVSVMKALLRLIALRRNMEVYKKIFRLENRKLRTSKFLHILQEVASDHCEMIGYGGDVVGPMGLMWVIVRQKLEVYRYPKAGEEILVRTWPNPDRHGFFPRQYIVESLDGEKLAAACAIWSLVDVNSKKLVRPESYGINFGGLITGEEQPKPRGTVKIEQTEERKFIVPEEYLDVNKHMNNTRYYDLAEDSIGAWTEEAELAELTTEYVSEALLGDSLTVRYGTDGESWYVTGDTDKTIFRMNLKYK